MNSNGKAQDTLAKGSLLAFAHIGDLHISDAKQQNYRDFL